MARKRFNKTANSILKSLNEAIRWAAGEDVPGVKVTHMRVPKELDVKTMCKNLGISQNEFARRFGSLRK